MTGCSPKKPRPRGYSTITLPFDKLEYEKIVHTPDLFRKALDQLFQQFPELFPDAFASGYTFKDQRISAKLGITIRRIECRADGAAFSIRPTFVMPYMTIWTDDAADPLFLRKFSVPYWALAKLYGHDPMFWYRLETGLGRNSIVGTTFRQAELPEHLVADEHHQTLNGEKVYIATTVAQGCCLGAELSPTANADDLKTAYEVFKEEAQNVEPGYQPKTVNTDGWAATQQAWLLLFSTICIVRCFLHSWLNVRDRAKHLGSLFRTIGEKKWNVYQATNVRSFRQRMRRLKEWAQSTLTAGAVKDQVMKLCRRCREFAVAYGQAGCHRTSNMLDRVMKLMHRYFDTGQHLHGRMKSAGKRCRAWALLHNFSPWSPETCRANEGYRSPAERLNRHTYHDNWLQNLQASASMAGYRR